MNTANMNILYNPGHKWISEDEAATLEFIRGRGDQITYFVNDNIKASVVTGNFFDQDEKTIILDKGRYYIRFNDTNQIIVKLPEFNSVIFNLYTVTV